MKKALFVLSFVALVVVAAPLAAQATYEATVDSITLTDGSAADVTVIDTPSNPPEEGTVEDTFGVQYDAPGTTYIGKFTITDTEQDVVEPMLVISGGIINSTSWDDTAKQLTVNWTGDQFVIPGQTTYSNESAFVIVRPNSTNPSRTNPDMIGPPLAMSGGYIYTNIRQWEMNPPEGPEDYGFGLTLDGNPGDTGYYGMLLTADMIDLFNTMADDEVTTADLAMFIDGYEASVKNTITDDGGILFRINVTFKANSTNASALGTAAATSVSKSVMAQEKEPLSAAFKKFRKKKGKTAKIYGWLKTGKKNKAIKIFRKKKGASKYKLIKTVKTSNKKGYYSHSFKVKKTGTYFYKVKNKTGKKKSSRIRLKVVK